MDFPYQIFLRRGRNALFYIYFQQKAYLKFPSRKYLLRIFGRKLSGREWQCAFDFAGVFDGATRVGYLRDLSRQRRTACYIQEGKILARLFHPIVTVETRWISGRVLSPTSTRERTLCGISNPPSSSRRIARTRVAGEVSPDWRPWTIDQPETSPLF